MKRIYGDKPQALVECIDKHQMIYRIRWDIKDEYNKELDWHYISYNEAELDHQPTDEEIQQVVLNGYNQIIDEHILKDFIWKGMPIWLSQENQFNYKAAYDMAKESNGANLPITFKFGHDTDIFYEFKTLDELSDFYHKAMKFINDTLNEGWKTKAAIDWSKYKIE